MDLKAELEVLKSVSSHSASASSHSIVPDEHIAAARPNHEKSSESDLSKGSKTYVAETAITSEERKFTIVIHGVDECPKGTSRHLRSTNDVKEISQIITRVNPEIPENSIRDCVRLGKYNEAKKRPMLVRLSRTYDVSSILSNRKVLRNTKHVIKPNMSKAEREIEFKLLKERWNLISDGTDRSAIRISGSSIFVNKQRYGTITDNEFVRVPNREQEEDNTDTAPPSVEIPADTNHHTTSFRSGPYRGHQYIVSNSLSILLYNVRSLVPKIDDLKAECTVRKPDNLICITETWLDSEITDHEVCIDGYEIIRLDRNRNGGGVAILISSNLTFKAIVADSITECLIISVLCGSAKVCIGVLYRPPSSNADYLDHLLTMLSNLDISHFKSFVLLGDFNIDFSFPNHPQMPALNVVISSFLLHQVVPCPTHFSHLGVPSLIDLVFCPNLLIWYHVRSLHHWLIQTTWVSMFIIISPHNSKEAKHKEERFGVTIKVILRKLVIYFWVQIGTTSFLKALVWM